MLIMFSVSALLFFICFTLGKSFFCFLKIEKVLLPTDFIFMGMAVVNTFFTSYSLFFKTDATPVFILLVLCFFILFFLKTGLREFFGGFEKKTALATLPFAFLLCYIAASVPIHYDSGLYHIQAIKWIEQYAIVPGLGNLHGRLAFNPNFFNLSAGFSFSGIFGQPIYAVNVFFGIVYLYFVISTISVFGKNIADNRQSTSDILFLFFLGAFSILYLSARVSYPTPDLAAGLLPFYLFMRYLYSKNENLQISPATIAFFIIISVYILTIKLSSLPILLFPILLSLKYKPAWSRKLFFRTSLTCVLIVLPWLIRNYYLSGYLIFPFPSIDIFNPDWKIPYAAADFEHRSVADWAKMQGKNYMDVEKMSIRQWFPSWFKGISTTWRVLFLLAFSSPIFILIKSLFPSKTSIKGFLLNLKSEIRNPIWLTAFTGTCFWFFTAPDVRFGFPFIIAAGLSFIFFLEKPLSILFDVTRLNFKYDPYIFVGLLFIVQVKQFLFIRHDAVSGIQLVKPLAPDSQTFYRSVDVEGADKNIEYSQNPIEYTIKKLGTFNLSVPIKDDRCYCRPLPCTPYYNDKLILRGESLQEGFKINGTSFGNGKW